MDRLLQGVTNFTDLSYEDFAKQYLMAPAAMPSGLRRSKRRRGRCANPHKHAAKFVQSAAKAPALRTLR